MLIPCTVVCFAAWLSQLRSMAAKREREREWKGERNPIRSLSRSSTCCEISFWIVFFFLCAEYVYVLIINFRISPSSERPLCPSINQLSCQWMLSLLASSYLIFCPWHICLLALFPLRCCRFAISISIFFHVAIYLFTFFFLQISRHISDAVKLVCSIHNGLNQYYCVRCKMAVSRTMTPGILGCECAKIANVHKRTTHTQVQLGMHIQSSMKRTYTLWVMILLNKLVNKSLFRLPCSVLHAEKGRGSREWTEQIITLKWCCLLC